MRATRTAVLVLLLTCFAPAFAAAAAAADAAVPEDLPRGWYARIETSKGTMIVRLLPEQAPQSVAHFAALAEGRLAWVDPFTGEEKTEPYYDGLIIHKVESAERFETGDPTGTGRGSAPFYVPPEGGGPVNFFRGNVVGMTRAPLGKTSGAQFFVAVTPQPWLTGKHPCFGELVAGQEIAFEITTVPADEAGKPKDTITIDRIRLFKVGEIGPLPEPVPYTPPPQRFGPSE